jgi:phosphatidylserine/phosphatidylglycerophosphate/cardiolipin synthase-like enzyme
LEYLEDIIREQTRIIEDLRRQIETLKRQEPECMNYSYHHKQSSVLFLPLVYSTKDSKTNLIKNVVIPAIKKAETSIDLLMFQMNCNLVVNALIARLKEKPGIKIRVILDDKSLRDVKKDDKGKREENTCLVQAVKLHDNKIEVFLFVPQHIFVTHGLLCSYHN